MIDESKQDLLVQYLLNEVDAPTAEKIRTEMETDAELREFVRETEDAFASLALTAPAMEPPAGLSQRILQSERRVLPFSEAGSRPQSRPKIVWLVLPWALAACFAIACAILQLAVTGLHKEQRAGSSGTPRGHAKKCPDPGTVGSPGEEKRLCGDPDCHPEGAGRQLRNGLCGGRLGQRAQKRSAPGGKIASRRKR